MKKIKLVLSGILLLFAIILINGCVQPQPTQPSAPYLTDIQVKPDFVNLNKNIEINFIVNNPLSVAFQGKVSFKSNCFKYSYNQIEKDVSVSANGKKPFQTTTTISNSKECAGIQQIVLTLEDTEAKKVDSKAVEVNVVE